MAPRTEMEASAQLLLMHLRGMTARLRQLSADQWDYSFALPAPTPRILALNTLQWLKCDRQHMTAASFDAHQLIPEPGDDPEAICAALDEEANEWEALLKSLTPEELDRVVRQFDGGMVEMNIRSYVSHMVQNVIYKSGQFSTIYFGLGLDGDGKYECPWPNQIYAVVLKQREQAKHV
jgi:hypothetical protein